MKDFGYADDALLLTDNKNKVVTSANKTNCIIMSFKA